MLQAMLRQTACTSHGVINELSYKAKYKDDIFHVKIQ